jgi:hypothetical protein
MDALFAQACSGARVVPQSFLLNFTDPLSLAAVEVVLFEQVDSDTGLS